MANPPPGTNELHMGDVLMATLATFLTAFLTFFRNPTDALLQSCQSLLTITQVPSSQPLRVRRSWGNVARFLIAFPLPIAPRPVIEAIFEIFHLRPQRPDQRLESGALSPRGNRQRGAGGTSSHQARKDSDADQLKTVHRAAAARKSARLPKQTGGSQRRSRSSNRDR